MALTNNDDKYPQQSPLFAIAYHQKYLLSKINLIPEKVKYTIINAINFNPLLLSSGIPLTEVNVI